MWLPRPVYEALPYVLLAGGLLVAGLVFLFSGSGWLQNTVLILAGSIAVAGLVLLLKRRDYRLSRSRIKYDRLD